LAWCDGSQLGKKRLNVAQPIPKSPEHAREVVRVASAILTASIGIIDGARKISDVHLYSGHAHQPKDEGYILFLSIDRRTSHQPLGEVRKRWAADALLRKDAEIKDREGFYRESAFRAAQNLVGGWKLQPWVH
jgi:hypothetical protein